MSHDKKERSAVAEATDNVSKRAKHAITSGNAVGLEMQLAFPTVPAI